MNEERRKSERRVPPAVVEFAVEERQQLLARIQELEAWKAEELSVMNPLMDYARSVCTGPLGCSLTEWLVSDHQRLAALKAQPSGVVPVVLADCFFHALPDEDDWEVHDPRHMSGDCDGCVKAVIVSRADWESLNSSPASAGEQPRSSYQGDPRSPSELSLAGCNCVRFGEGNPHWPCKLHTPVSACGVDERAAFEAWYLGHFYMGDKQCGLEWLSTELCGGYRHQHPAEQWIVWQARAALSAPSHGEQVRELPKQLAAVKVSLRMLESGRGVAKLEAWDLSQLKPGMNSLYAAPSLASLKEQGE